MKSNLINEKKNIAYTFWFNLFAFITLAFNILLFGTTLLISLKIRTNLLFISQLFFTIALLISALMFYYLYVKRQKNIASTYAKNDYLFLPLTNIKKIYFIMRQSIKI